MIVKNTIMLFFIMLTLCCLAFDAHAARVALITKNSSSSLAAVGKNTATPASASITAIGRANNEDDDADEDADDDANEDADDDADGDVNEDDDAADKNANEDDDADANDDIAAGVNAAIDNELKTEVQAGNDVSAVSVWSVVRGLWSWFKDDLKDSIFGDDRAVEGRTFGKIRRLQMAIIPLMFKLGLLTAMIGFLVLLGMKTIFLLKVLLFINVVALFSKFLTLKSSLIGQQQYSAPSLSYAGGWATAPAGGGDHHQQQHSKEIHLHIHGGAQAQPQVPAESYSTYGSGAEHHWNRRSDPYAAYDPAVQGETAVLENQLNNELNNEWNIAEPVSFSANKHPLNHRLY